MKTGIRHRNRINNPKFRTRSASRLPAMLNYTPYINVAFYFSSTPTCSCLERCFATAARPSFTSASNPSKARIISALRSDPRLSPSSRAIYGRGTFQKTQRRKEGINRLVVPAAVLIPTLDNTHMGDPLRDWLRLAVAHSLVRDDFSHGHWIQDVRTPLPSTPRAK